MVTFGRRTLGDRPARLGERAGGDRAGEDEAAQPEPAARVEQQPGGADVGALVLGVLFTAEIVERGEVDGHVNLATGTDLGAGFVHRFGFREVDLVPLDRPVPGFFGVGARMSVDGDDPMAAAQQPDQVATEEA